MDPERIMQYEIKYKELCDGGGHMMDFVALNRMYNDVIEFKKCQELLKKEEPT